MWDQHIYVHPGSAIRTQVKQPSEYHSHHKIKHLFLYYGEISLNYRLSGKKYYFFRYIVLEKSPTMAMLTPGGLVNVLTTCEDWGYSVK